MMNVYMPSQTILEWHMLEVDRTSTDLLHNRAKMILDFCLRVDLMLTCVFVFI